MAEIVGAWTVDPSILELSRQMISRAEEGFLEMFGLALDETVDRWGRGGGYNDSGEEISWNGLTKKGPPVLLDTGNLLEPLEYVILEDGHDFKFDITSTAEVYGRKGEMYAVTPQNVSIWNSWIPHKNVPKQYREGGEAYTKVRDEAFQEVVKEWLDRGDLRLTT